MKQTFCNFVAKVRKKIMIYYFSGTGNSRWAAEYIAKAANDKLANIADCINGTNDESVNDIHGADAIGFVFPVNGWMPPRIVRVCTDGWLHRSLEANTCRCAYDALTLRPC